MTDRICIASNGTIQTEISYQDLLTCCKSCGYGCDGGFLINSWQYWMNNGLVSGGPYNTSRGCKSYTIPAKCKAGGELQPFCKKKATPKCEAKCDKSNIVYNNDKTYAKSAYAVRKIIRI